jgi:hypothetical protein
LGIPYSANPLAVTWYPLAAMRLLHVPYDVYELCAYIVAACGAFALARRVTGSTTGGLVAGVVYALSGFMIGHAGHVGLIHPAAWVPWLFWALVRLRDDGGTRNLALVALSYAMLAIAGQPDIWIYTLFAAAAYCIVARSWRYSARVAAGFALGTALAAVTLLPGAELALASVRVNQSLEEHVGFAVPLASLPFRLLFPYLLGQTVMPPYTYSGTNIGSFAEMSNYVGVTTLVLALIGLTARSVPRLAFWGGLTVAALALSTGNDLGLGTLTYHVPVLGWLRAPGRYAFEVALGAAVLAAAGVASLERADAGPRCAALCWAAVAAVMTLMLAVVAIFGRVLLGLLARAFGIANPPAQAVDPLLNAALWLPVLALICGGVAIAALVRWPRAPAARMLLVAAATADVVSFGWFAYWNYGAFPLTRLDEPAYAASLRDAIAPAAQRVLSVPTLDVSAALAPNLNVLWNIAGVRGYTNLALAKPAAFLRVDSLRTLRGVLADPDRTLDAAGVRYAVVPEGMLATRPANDPFDPGSALALRVGSGVPDVPLRVSLDVPALRATSRVALVSFLAESAGIADGAPVAELRLFDAGGGSEAVTLRAGSGPSRVDLLALPQPIVAHKLEVRWRATSAPHGVLDVERLSLLDDRQATATPFTALTFLQAAPRRWRAVHTTAGDRIFENVRAFPRAWTVHQAVSMSPDDALAAIVARHWDPARTMLVDGSVPQLAQSTADEADSAQVVRVSPATMLVDVHCRTACALVTSDAVYPGWSARVDADATPILAADYAFRAVVVPAGSHRVTFAFRPRSTLAGAAVTLAAFGITLRLVLRRRGTRGKA